MPPFPPQCDELVVGNRYKMRGFKPSSKTYRHRLLAMGLTTNITFTIKRIAPLGDPFEIVLRGYSLSLRREEMDGLILEQL